jgi:hypothetical protein
MTQEELTTISNTVKYDLKCYVDDLFRQRGDEIPYLIRKELDNALDSEIRAFIRNKIRDRILVDVKINNYDPINPNTT